MIYLTRDTVPSSLLYLGEEVDLCQRLLQRAREYREIGEWDRALKAAREVQTSSCSKDATVLRAAALLHISDIYREWGRLGPALRSAREGYDIFSYQAKLAQQHNAAVGAYSLGMIHHMLGNFSDAINWYRSACEKFEQAEKFWSEGRMLSYKDTCTRIQAWIRSLSNCLADEAQDPCFILPARTMGESELSSAPVQMAIREYVLEGEVVIENRAFQARGMQGGPVRLPVYTSCRVYEVPDVAQPFVGAQEGDYVLVERTDSRQVQANPRLKWGVVEEDAGAEFVHFRRNAAGNINLESMSSGRIIGGTTNDDLPLYSLIALLRPV